MKRITIQLSQLHQLRINLIQNKRLIQGLFKYTMVYEYSTVCTTSKSFVKKRRLGTLSKIYVEIILLVTQSMSK